MIAQDSRFIIGRSCHSYQNSSCARRRKRNMATVEQTNTQSQAKETNSEAVKEGLDEKCSEEFKENECKEEGGNEDQKKESITTPADITQTKENILTQVEYYFGNKNLRTDTFLNREMKKDPNGCILDFIIVI